MKSLIATAALVLIIVSAPLVAGPKGTEEAGKQVTRDVAAAERSASSRSGSKPAYKCSYEKVVGSNRRQRVCRRVVQTQEEEKQARETFRELKDVMPEL